MLYADYTPAFLSLRLPHAYAPRDCRGSRGASFVADVSLLYGSLRRTRRLSRSHVAAFMFAPRRRLCYATHTTTQPQPRVTTASKDVSRLPFEAAHVYKMPSHCRVGQAWPEGQPDITPRGRRSHAAA